MKKHNKILLIVGMIILIFIGGYFLKNTPFSLQQSDNDFTESAKIDSGAEEKTSKTTQNRIVTETVTTEELTTEIKIPMPPESNESFVKVTDYIPDIFVDLKYASTDNFTGQAIYDFTDAYLRYGTVEKLMKVQEELKKQGLYIKIWDAFRPVSAQFKLWEVCPNSTYVANPNKGYSSHSKGNTLDITVVDENGNEIFMPTGFDDFSALADRNYSDCEEEAANNAKMLENLMANNGFEPYFGEWWHFSDVDSYPVEKNDIK